MVFTKPLDTGYTDVISNCFVNSVFIFKMFRLKIQLDGNIFSRGSVISVKTQRLAGATGSRVVFTVVVSGLTRRGFNLCVAPSYRNWGVL